MYYSTNQILQCLYDTAHLCRVNNNLTEDTYLFLHNLGSWSTEHDRGLEGDELICQWSLQHYNLMSPMFWQSILGESEHGK